MSRFRFYFTCGRAPCITGIINAGLFSLPLYALILWIIYA